MNRDRKVSVIIPACNAAPTIGQCLEAVGSQSYSADEVIVVDDGSTDDTAGVAETFGVRVIRQPNQGPGAARNRGAAEAEGDVLMFTDADCAPAPDWVERMMAGFGSPDVAGAKGTYETRQRGLVPRFVQLEYESRYDRMAGQESIDFVDTYSAGYRRGVFDESGGFDEALRMDQDQELSFRLAEAGERLVFVPEARVYHVHDRTVQEYVRRKFRIGYWKVQVVQAHPAKAVADSHTPQTLKLQMGLAALGGILVVAGVFDRDFVVAGLAAWGLLLFSGIPFLAKVWRRDRGVMLVAPLMLFLRAWALGLGFLAGMVRCLVGR
jgi:cellulose synthase/poly-beta-1,6-N-acetylglucosamine synthase-like glycosyltransferase